jgi:hypothetical protein
MKKEFVFRVVLAAAIFFLVYQFGVRPFLHNPDKGGKPAGQSLTALLEPDDGTDYDVIVYGIEPQGISAAISAARLGARTLLIGEGADAGGTMAACLVPELEVPVSNEQSLLNGGILADLYKELGSGFSDKKYISVTQKLLGAEKKLTVLYNTSLQGVSMNGGSIGSLKLLSDGMAKTTSGRMFIDASDKGELLDACKVSYFTGSGDLNLPESFIPVGLNFEMAPSKSDDKLVAEVKKLIGNREKFHEGIRKYEPLNLHSRIDELKIFFTEQNKAVISGVQVSGVPVLDEGKLAEAYGIASREAENLARFLSAEFEQFSEWKLTRTAEELLVRESRHYYGKYRLTVNNILNNKYFDDTVAMGSYPVLIGKFADTGSYVAGKPAQYGIPLGCLVPERTANLLMAGPRSSYSSIASSSAGTIGTGIATGEAAGAAAVFCLAKNESPALLLSDREKLEEFRSVLASQNMHLPNRKIVDKNSGNWAYPAVRQLLSLGLIAGGNNNNLNFNRQATQKDLGFVLINGIYRLDKESYSLELDARLRPLLTEDPLTFEKAVAMLGAFYKTEGGTNEIYKKLCEQSHINDVMQLRMKDRKTLTMADVYYLGAYSIRSFTGRDIPG